MNTELRMPSLIALVISVMISLGAGAVGSLFTTPQIGGWYATLVKPALNPPAWVFGPVWTTLFVLMGVAAFLVWSKGVGRKEVRSALVLFVIQLVLNTLWSVIFFGMQSPQGALVDILFLWVAILATMAAFAKISKAAAWLLVPYIAWVSFAAYLNFSIYALN